MRFLFVVDELARVLQHHTLNGMAWA